MKHTDIVVGVDGSDESRKALRWAAAEARRREAKLKILTAYSGIWPLEAPDGLGERSENLKEQFRETLAEALAEALSVAVVEARTVEPSIEVTGLVVLGAGTPDGRPHCRHGGGG